MSFKACLTYKLSKTTWNCFSLLSVQLVVSIIIQRHSNLWLFTRGYSSEAQLKVDNTTNITGYVANMAEKKIICSQCSSAVKALNQKPLEASDIVQFKSRGGLTFIIIIMLRISHSIVQTKLPCELHQYCNI